MSLFLLIHHILVESLLLLDTVLGAGDSGGDKAEQHCCSQCDISVSDRWSPRNQIHELDQVFSFFKKLINLFIFGCVGSLLLCAGFL